MFRSHIMLELSRGIEWKYLKNITTDDGKTCLEKIKMWMLSYKRS